MPTFNEGAYGAGGYSKESWEDEYDKDYDPKNESGYYENGQFIRAGKHESVKRFFRLKLQEAREEGYRQGRTDEAVDEDKYMQERYEQGQEVGREEALREVERQLQWLKKESAIQDKHLLVNDVVATKTIDLVLSIIEDIKEGKL